MYFNTKFVIAKCKSKIEILNDINGFQYKICYSKITNENITGGGEEDFNTKFVIAKLNTATKNTLGYENFNTKFVIAKSIIR